MTKHVRRDALLDANGFGSITDDPVELACRDGHQGIAPREQPQLGPRHPPVVAQDCQQACREHRVPVFLALALLDADQHALAEVGDLGYTQPSAIGHAHCALYLMPGAATRSCKTSSLLSTVGSFCDCRTMVM